MMLPSFTRRTVFRVALTYAVLFLSSVIAIFAVIYQLITRELEGQLRSHIIELRDTLVEINVKDGFSALADVVESKPAPSAVDESIYLLLDDKGAYRAGNIKSAPRFTAWKQIEWDEIQPKQQANAYEGTASVRALWTPIAEGYLLVGDSANDIEQTQDLLLDGLWGWLALAMLSALGGGAWLGSQAQLRIQSLEKSLSAVARGELQTRIALSQRGDDLDHVSGQINATLDQLQGAVTSLSQVTTDIAHDLKTPIGRMRQRLDILRRTGTTLDDYKNAVDELQEEIDGVIATFEALLRIAQIESRARKARFSPVDIKDVLERLADAYKYVAEDANQSLVASLSSTAPLVITGDKELLTQLFSNLIENSIRHCPAGSRISIEAQGDGSTVVVSVCDDGPGIPEHERDKVFQRLYRLQKSRTTPGSGLGLSLVAAIAKLHEARIVLSDNRPGLKVEVAFDASILRSVH